MTGIVRKWIWIFCLCLLLPAGSASAADGRLTVAAASSLRAVFGDLVARYQEAYPDQEVVVVYGSSGKLTTQILNGAPFDLFFSADLVHPGKIAEAGFAATPPKVYARGRIALWSRTLDVTPLALGDLAMPEIRRIAIANPDLAPYGMRAREALQAAGVWDAIQPRLVFGENIAQVAQMAQSEAADVAVIALSLARVPELADRPGKVIDDALHQPLAHAFVVTRRGGDNAQAPLFAAFIQNDSSRALFETHGFSAAE